MRHADYDADSASWISSGSTITLQTLQIPLSALSRMTIICTIGWLRFILTSSQPDPFVIFLFPALAYVNKQPVLLVYAHCPSCIAGRRSGQPGRLSDGYMQCV